MTTEKQTLVQKLLVMMEHLGHVEKKGHVAFGRTAYDYHRDTDVSDAVRKSCLELGIVFIPQVYSLVCGRVKTIEGEANTAEVVLNVDIINTDDVKDTLRAITAGVGYSTGDKALAIATTRAMKNLWLKMCSVGDGEDGEQPQAGVDLRTPYVHSAQSENPAQMPAMDAVPQAPKFNPAGGPRANGSPSTPEGWAAYWSQFSHVYKIPYADGQAASVKEALREAKGQFRGGKDWKTKIPNGDTGADKCWYTHQDIPGLSRYLIGNPRTGAAKAEAEVSFESDTLPF